MAKHKIFIVNTELDLIKFFQGIDAETSDILEALAQSVIEEDLEDNSKSIADLIRTAAAAVGQLESENDGPDDDGTEDLIELMQSSPKLGQTMRKINKVMAINERIDKE